MVCNLILPHLVKSLLLSIWTAAKLLNRSIVTSIGLVLNFFVSRMEDDQRGDGDSAVDPGLQEGGRQIRHHHLSQAWSSVAEELTVTTPLPSPIMWIRGPMAVYLSILYLNQ